MVCEHVFYFVCYLQERCVCHHQASTCSALTPNCVSVSASASPPNCFRSFSDQDGCCREDLLSEMVLFSSPCAFFVPKFLIWVKAWLCGLMLPEPVLALLNCPNPQRRKKSCGQLTFVFGIMVSATPDQSTGPYRLVQKAMMGASLLTLILRPHDHLSLLQCLIFVLPCKLIILIIDYPFSHCVKCIFVKWRSTISMSCSI